MSSQLSCSGSLAQVQKLIGLWFKGRHIQIYEAGGGSYSFLPGSLIEDAKITVVDIDEVQLHKNSYAHQKLLGDVQQYSFPASTFDLVVCYNVIEHLESPDAAIRQFVRALKPNGMLFIGAPNPDSLSGLVTKFTPHAFHIWFYRAVLEQRNAGGPGHPPFRTVFHPLVRPSRLVEYCCALGFELVYLNEYQTSRLSTISDRSRLFGWAIDCSIAVLNLLTLRRRDYRNGDYHALFVKRELTTGDCSSAAHR